MTKPPTGGFFIYHCNIGNPLRARAVPLLATKGVYYVWVQTMVRKSR